MALWQDAFLTGGPNPRLGSRFNAEGQFLPEHGNTVVAQVTAGSATEAALIDLRSALMALPHADHFAFTPIQSYHMTVFEGVIETRRARGYWPDDLPLDARDRASEGGLTATRRRKPLRPDAWCGRIPSA